MKWLNDFMLKHNYWANVINAILLILIGLSLSFYSDIISSCSRDFFSCLFDRKLRDFYEWHWGTAAFWILQIISGFYLIRLMFCQTKIEDEKVKEQKKFIGEVDNRITAAIHNAPNPDCFPIYVYTYFKIDKELKKITDEIKKGTITLEFYEEVFKFVLDKIQLITETFNPIPGASYCANIMPYIHADDNKHLIGKMIKDGQIFAYHESDSKTYYVRGILQGRKELLISKERKLEIPIINLPVLTTKSGSVVYIPGACTAINELENVVPTTNLDERSRYDHLPKIFWERFQSFFHDGGKEIGSIVSFVIPHPDFVIDRESLSPKGLNQERPEILGVLNIDSSSSSKCIIGEFPKYYDTYFGMIWPIILKLAPYFHKYLELQKESQKLMKSKKT